MKRISATILLSFGLLFAALAGGAGMAGAQPVANTAADCYGGTCPTPTVNTTPHQPTTTDPVFTTASTPSSSALAFTGTDAVASAVVGLALIGGGTVLVGATRRRRHVA